MNGAFKFYIEVISSIYILLTHIVKAQIQIISDYIYNT